MSGILLAATASGSATGGVVNNPLPGRFASASAAFPSTATAELAFVTDGIYTATSQANTNWFTPTTPGIGSSYWVRATLNSGTTPSGPAMGTWVQVNVNRVWSLTQAGIGTVSCVLDLAVATDSGGTNIVSTGQAGIQADVV